MKTSRIILAAVFGMAVVSAASPTLRADEARITALRQSIDELDVKIKQVVRDISNTTDADAGRELNTQLKQYEGERSTAVYDLYKAQEEEREKEKLQAEKASLMRAATEFVSDFDAWKKEFDAHNADAMAQHAAVDRFVILSESQKTRAEAERLLDWGRRIDERKARVDSRQASLSIRRTELLKWADRLDARGGGL